MNSGFWKPVGGVGVSSVKTAAAGSGVRGVSVMLLLWGRHI
jgi:hypothetical protein